MRDKKPPLISVIIPVYNGEPYLAEAIESVLAQTHRPFEVIVVDDGSTDQSAEVARRFTSDIRYCYQRNAGTGSARNLGIELAQGNFLAFLDADDIWIPEKLEYQIAIFATQAKIDMIFGHAKQFYSSEVKEHIQKKNQFHTELMPARLPSAILIKRESFFRVGPFETAWQVGQDVDWYVRAKELGLREFMMPDVVYMRRIHETNKGITQRQHVSQRVRILKASLDRRRKQGSL